MAKHGAQQRESRAPELTAEKRNAFPGCLTPGRKSALYGPLPGSQGRGFLLPVSY
jgi:hypothetical protein